MSKCLSLRQPYAELVVSGRKTIELRKWNTRFRGEFLIHASKSTDRKHANYTIYFLLPGNSNASTLKFVIITSPSSIIVRNTLFSIYSKENGSSTYD